VKPLDTEALAISFFTAQVGELWWIITVKTSEQGWDIKQFKPAKGREIEEFRGLSSLPNRSLLPFKINSQKRR